MIIIHFQPQRENLFYLFKPFRKEVWYTAALVFVLAMLLYVFLDSLSTSVRSGKIFNKNLFCGNAKDKIQAAWYIVQIWLPQSKYCVSLPQGC